MQKERIQDYFIEQRYVGGLVGIVSRMTSRFHT